jgi:hypothetical protein
MEKGYKKASHAACTKTPYRVWCPLSDERRRGRRVLGGVSRKRAREKGKIASSGGPFGG